MAVSCRDNAGPTNLQMYSKVALETRKFSFHQPSSDLSFSNLSNQSCGRGRLHTLRRARALVSWRRICLVKTAVLCCIIASNRHLWHLLRIKYRIKKQAEIRRHDSKRTMDIRHANSLESNSIMMTQEVGIQFPATFVWHLFYLGKSLFACNRWNHGKLKPKCDVPRENLPWEKPFTVVYVTAPYIVSVCSIVHVFQVRVLFP